MADLKKLILALATAGLLSCGVGQAALFDRGGGLIYDSDFDITWLSDANYAMTQYNASGGALGDADGRMNWSTASTWAANLVYHDSVRNVDYTDWRLYSALNKDGSGPPCEGLNCTGSELGHLFYTEGQVLAQRSILTSTILDDYFINMQSSGAAYWSDTHFAAGERADQNNPWHFHTDLGFQDSFTSPNNLLYAWAVRTGDVATPVPEPEIYAMMGLGLGLVGWAGRRKKLQAAAA